jgi:hypothetical protein
MELAAGSRFFPFKAAFFLLVSLSSLSPALQFVVHFSRHGLLSFVAQTAFDAIWRGHDASTALLVLYDRIKIIKNQALSCVGRCIWDEWERAYLCVYMYIY